jgi:hypothetical protein
LPAGTYYVSTYVACKTGVNMTGDGDGRGAKTSWIKGQVKTASNVSLSDLKMGREGPEYYGFGRTATSNMTVTRCTITGGPASGNLCGVIAYDSDLHDVQFLDCIIEGNPTNYRRDGVALVNYGQVSARMYNIDFRNCTFRSGGRIGFEITSRWDGSHDYVYPIRNVNLINCTFEPMGASAISWGMTSPDTTRGSGVWTDGYSTISGCTIEDAGAYASTNAGKHGIELAGPVHMTLIGNTVRGSHVRAMLSMTNSSGRRWWDGGELDTYNVISGNTFDGRQSANSTLDMMTSRWTFSNNTVYLRTQAYCENGRNNTLAGNHFYAVAADGSTPSTVYHALYVVDTDSVTFSGNTFSSAVSSGIVQCRADWTYTTRHSTNNVFNGNTYAGGGSRGVWVVAGSSASGTDEVKIYRP